MEYANSYARIDLDILKENTRKLKEKTGAPLLLVVKADGYGHGAVPIAKHLEEDCAFFGVATVPEALALRTAGIQKPLLILGHTPVWTYPNIVGLGIRPAIFSYADAEALSHAAQKKGVTVPFHFAVDTGMSRIGFQATEADADICAKIARLPNLEPEGLFSHFACADCADQTRTLQQQAMFDRFCQLLEQRGVSIRLRHIENSAGLINLQKHYDMVRAGIVLYGMDPSDEVTAQALGVKPALSWHTHVSFVKTLEAGRQISYGGKYTLHRQSVIATIPVGYADGYRRGMDFYVLIRGQKAPILGTICMDQFMVDVTDIPGVQPGDPVTLIGQDGAECITAMDMAKAANTICYEITCAISPRVPRHYHHEGERF